MTIFWLSLLFSLYFTECSHTYTHTHMGYTSPSELKQKTGFVFLGLQKLQGIFE